VTTRLSPLLTAFVLAALLTAGCGRNLPFDVSLAPTLAATASEVGELTLTSFAQQVRDSGVAVRVRGEVSQPFFEVDGQLVDIAGESVQVYEYADTYEARAAADAVAEDGRQIAAGDDLTFVDWISTPHFYQRDRLIVVYVGEHDGVLHVLDGALGDPFAGASAYPGPAVRTAH